MALTRRGSLSRHPRCHRPHMTPWSRRYPLLWSLLDSHGSLVLLRGGGVGNERDRAGKHLVPICSLHGSFLL